MPRFQLVKSPMDNGLLPEDRWYLPLDLLAVATAAEAEGSDVSILDGSTRTLSEIEEYIGVNTDLVGLTYSALSVKNFERLARLAHHRGVRTIVGGQAATASAESLAMEEFIDCVVVGDGEPAIREVIAQLRSCTWNPSAVPNSVSRNGTCLVWGPTELVSAEDIGRFSRGAGGLDAEMYVGAFADGNTLTNINAARATNIFSKRGCAAKCGFCARTDKRVRARDPVDVVREVAELSRMFDLDYIIDTSDTWVSKPSWLNSYLKARQASGERLPSMMVFADSRHIRHGVPELLAEAGINNVLLGIESASERVLLRNGKPNSQEQIRQAVEGLVSCGIRVSMSFVLGLAGEDDVSIMETRRFADSVQHLRGVLCYCNVIMPLPGSPLWAEFTATGRGSKWVRALDYELDAVRRDFVETMTSVSGGTRRLLNERDAMLAQNDLPRFEFAR